VTDPTRRHRTELIGLRAALVGIQKRRQYWLGGDPYPHSEIHQSVEDITLLPCAISPFELFGAPGATGAPDRSRFCREVARKARPPTRVVLELPASDRDRFDVSASDRSLVISASANPRYLADGQWRRLMPARAT